MYLYLLNQAFTNAVLVLFGESNTGITEQSGTFFVLTALYLYRKQ